MNAWILSDRPDFVDGVSSILREHGIYVSVLGPQVRSFDGLEGLLVVDAQADRISGPATGMEVPGANRVLETLLLDEPDASAIALAVTQAKANASLWQELDGYRSSRLVIGAVVRALNRPLSDADAIPAALLELMEHFHCSRLLMLSAEEGREGLSIFYQRHLPADFLAQAASPEGMAVMEYIFTYILSIVDVLEKALFLKFDPMADDRLLGLGGNAGDDFLLFTLKSNRRPVGMVIIAYDGKKSWSSQEKESLSILGMQLGLALENLQLFNRVQAARREWEVTVDSMRDMVFFADSDGIIQRSNAALAEYAGLSLPDIVGRKCSEVMTCGQRFEACPYKRVALRDGMAGFEMQGSDKSFYRILVTPYGAGGDHASGTVHLASDITLEKERLRLEVEMRQLLELDRLKNRFMASVSHELKTPLNAVIGFSEILLAGTYGEINRKQRGYLENIHTSGKHLLALISDILDYMRQEVDELSLHPEEFDMGELVASTLELMRREADRVGIRFSLRRIDVPCLLTADQRRVRQVLFNLISNALKFTPEGGYVEVRVQNEGDRVSVEVEDSGVGIAPEDQGKIFNEFTQVGEGARRAGGTGLGLALSRRLVELQGGSIRVESALGRGSTFSFTLPASPAVDARKKGGGNDV